MLLLQPSSLHNPKLSLLSTLSYSPSLPCKIPPFILTQFRTASYRKLSLTCSTSQANSYGTVDYETRPIIKWSGIYKNISHMDNPDSGSASVLDKWEREDRNLTKWELRRVAKELRKYKRHRQALEVYDWMNDKEDRFRLTSSDAAIQLDLIAKVRGVLRAEDYFLKLPDNLKDKRVYGALLNVYVSAKMRDKAESLFDRMRDKGYVKHCLPFNVMMTLYMNLKECDKVESIVSEMKKKRVRLDNFSYNIWLSSSQSGEKMEQVYEQMKLDTTIPPKWTTFSTMATMYIKMADFEKAEDCLRKVEANIKGSDRRIPYHYLISLYSSVGNKEEVYRAWEVYKSIFPTIPNLGYHTMISSLIRIEDIEGAEKIYYTEWLPVKLTYDPRIANLFIRWYIKNGNFDKAKSFFEHMVEVGGKPNSSTWEILAEGHIGSRRIPEAVSCLKEAFSADRSLQVWRPKPLNVTTFFKLCEEDSDTASKDVVIRLFRQSRHLKDKAYASLIGLSDEASMDSKLSVEDVDEGGSEFLVDELQGSL